MKEIYLISKEDKSMAVIKVDAIDGNELFTVMWCEGVKDKKFESLIPWKCGSVISLTELNEFVNTYQSIIDMYMYEGEIKQRLIGSPIRTLSLTVNITNASETSVILVGTKQNCYPSRQEIVSKDGVQNQLEIIEGYLYSFELFPKDSWTTSAPQDFLCNGDKTVELDVTVTV